MNSSSITKKQKALTAAAITVLAALSVLVIDEELNSLSDKCATQIEGDGVASIFCEYSRLLSSSDEIATNGYLPPKGEWIKEPNRTFAAPTCCGWDGNHFLDNPEACGTSALSTYEMVGRKDFLAQTGGHGCTCNARGFQDDYVWKWDGKETKKWDAHEACHKLGNRTVLMIGDSTMGQAAATLMNALFPAGCQTQFTYAICDTLVGYEMGNLNRCGLLKTNWTDLVNMYDPDLVILSAGPHIFKRSNYNTVMNHVIEGTKHLKKTKPQLQVAWKTQQPAGCSDDIMTEVVLENKYQYNEFYERDLYALSVLPYNGIHTIDMRMLYYRSDAHVSEADCMHMCVPGPLDIIAPLFSDLLDRL